ncbi:MAG: hypothetical protein HUJ22_08785 [Gracilimonas sp.]|uniref:hypothetical protein n=1 Tax=Gracilimonas sp. TaxID=1974203 RepID=UPI0019AEBE1E|nr:hypothetical protein [Gracilimonas sp.]MBD3616656.1 hypothetical protein [Gracilimonas sp.]
MNSEQIAKNITRTEKEISELEERNSKLEQELFEIKKNHKALISDEGQEKIQKLTSSREIIKEVIEEKREKLDALQIELETAQKEEAMSSYEGECVALARRAEEAKDEFLMMLKELDSELFDKLVSISKKRVEWKKAAEKFIQTITKIEPSFRTVSLRDDTPEHEEARRELLQRIDEKAGSTDAARTEIFLSPHHYREVTLSGSGHGIDAKTPADLVDLAIRAHNIAEREAEVERVAKEREQLQEA